jgi:hypothetical protein
MINGITCQGETVSASQATETASKLVCQAKAQFLPAIELALCSLACECDVNFNLRPAQKKRNEIMSFCAKNRQTRSFGRQSALKRQNENPAARPCPFLCPFFNRSCRLYVAYLSPFYRKHNAVKRIGLQ